MSQPPKSTMRAPAARCRALRGVVFSKASPANKEKGVVRAIPLASPLCPGYLRDLTPSVDGRPSLSRDRGYAPDPTVLLPESLRVLPLRRPGASAPRALPVGCAHSTAPARG